MRKSLLLLLCASLLSIAAGARPVAAAGETITITQISPIDQLGRWLLTPPSGRPQSTNGDDEPVVTFTALTTGTYTLEVEPPLDADTTITVTRSGVLMKTVEGKKTTFTLPPNDAIAVEIRYFFKGTITVDSEPQGARFELRGPGKVRFTGTTPETFHNMPPLYYTVTYSRLPGCTTPPQQHRELEVDGRLDFSTHMTCTTMSTAEPTVNSRARREVAEPQNRLRGYLARVMLAPHQTEVMPGDTVEFTLSVRNTGTLPLNNLTLISQYNPSQLQVVRPLPEDGIVSGNLMAWRIPQLFAGELWSVTFRTVVADGVQRGEQMTILAHAESEDIDGSIASHASVARIGVPVLPETGANFALLFLLASAAVTVPLSMLPHSRRMPRTS